MNGKQMWYGMHTYVKICILNKNLNISPLAENDLMVSVLCASRDPKKYCNRKIMHMIICRLLESFVESSYDSFSFI